MRQQASASEILTFIALIWRANGTRVSNKVRPRRSLQPFDVFVRDPFLPHPTRQPPAHLAETSMLERFQFGPFCFSAQLSLPRTAKFTTTLIEP
jgi:hypothetical protein